jgi:hypothetical protein
MTQKWRQLINGFERMNIPTSPDVQQPIPSDGMYSLTLYS